MTTPRVTFEVSDVGLVVFGIAQVICLFLVAVWHDVYMTNNNLAAAADPIAYSCAKGGDSSKSACLILASRGK